MLTRQQTQEMKALLEMAEPSKDTCCVSYRYYSKSHDLDCRWTAWNKLTHMLDDVFSVYAE